MMRIALNKIPYRLTLFLGFLLGYYLQISAQQLDNPRIVDLKTQLENHKKNDTNKVNILTDIAYEYNKVSPYDGINYAMQAKTLSEDLHWTKGLIRSNSCIGANYFSLSDFSNAYIFWLLSLQLSEDIGFQRGIINHLFNIGNVFLSQKNYPRALEYYNKALVQNDKTGNKQLITNAYTAIGNVYAQMKDYHQALNYHFKALSIDSHLDKKADMAADRINIGALYSDMGEYDKALNMLSNALVVKKENGDQNGIAKAYSLMGKTFLRMAEKLSGQEWTNNLNLAILYIDSASSVAKQIGNLDILQQNLGVLSEAQEKRGDNNGAFKSYKQYIVIKDSIFSLEKQAAIFNLEKKAEIESQKRAAERAEEGHIRLRYLQIGIICIFIILLMTSILIIRKKAVHPKVIEVLGTFSVLITFEFIQLLLHGKIEEITHHNLILMLLCLLGVALIIVPAHHRIEHWIKKKLIQK